MTEDSAVVDIVSACPNSMALTRLTKTIAGIDMLH